VSDPYMTMLNITNYLKFVRNTQFRQLTAGSLVVAYKLCSAPYHFKILLSSCYGDLYNAMV